MPSTTNTLVCNICGADRSKTGRPFDEKSLAKHRTMFHRNDDASEEAPLSCDICGATTSGRGNKFLTMASLRQHKEKCHPENAVQSPAPPSRSRLKLAQPSSPSQFLARAVSHVKFCPCCGFNLTVVTAAMQFINGES